METRFGRQFKTIMAALTLLMFVALPASGEEKKQIPQTEQPPAKTEETQTKEPAAETKAPQVQNEKTEETQTKKPAAEAKAPQVQNENVALVNGIAITSEEFEREMAAVRSRFKMQGQKMNDAQLSIIQGNILEALINRELLYQESRKSGITIPDTEVDEQFAEWKKQFPDEAEFKDMMDKMGISESIIRDQLRERMMVQKFIDKEIGAKIEISDKETKDFYDANPDIFKEPEQVKASHILVKAAPEADAEKKAEARKKIEDIQKKLKKGEDFAELAKTFSEGPSKVKGGDLGYFARKQMVKPFEDVAFALSTGEISDIVETRFGYHLIKVFDKKSENVIAYEQAKNNLEQHLREQKILQEVNRYGEVLKAKAKIEKFL